MHQQRTTDAEDEDAFVNKAWAAFDVDTSILLPLIVWQRTTEVYAPASTVSGRSSVQAWL
jgi:hypothetical protein